MTESSGVCYLRLRGLPWSATKQDIVEFLKNVRMCEGENSILFTLSEEGKRSGDALVMVPTREDFEKALTYNRNYIGKRYVEVVPSDAQEYAYNEEKATVTENDSVIRLRGLPYSATEDDIREFFNGLAITENGVVILMDSEARCSGDAYVEFSDAHDAQEALKKHRQRIGARFIEIFKCSKQEMMFMSSSRPMPLMSINVRRKRGGWNSPPASRNYEQRYYSPPRDYGGQDEHYDAYEGPPEVERYIHMRGLPFGCEEYQIEDFFAPVPLVGIGFCFNQDGRFTGECDVYFECDEDVSRSMNKDRKRIGKRYVELFLRTRRMTYIRPRNHYNYMDKYHEPGPNRYEPYPYMEPNVPYNPYYPYQASPPPSGPGKYQKMDDPHHEEPIPKGYTEGPPQPYTPLGYSSTSDTKLHHSSHDYYSKTDSAPGSTDMPEPVAGHAHRTPYPEANPVITSDSNNFYPYY